jgi:large subunit ribosomal protein L13
MIVNGENLILGRLASHVAKLALLGEEVSVVNCNNIIVTGSKSNIIKNYKRKITMGNPFYGPFFPKRPERILKRSIRGMLPSKQPRGREALSIVKCYNDLPENVKVEEMVTFEDANVKKNKTLKFMKLIDICKEIGKYGK